MIGAVTPKRRTPVAELEFVGCRPLRASEEEITSPEWEGRRLEYWHAATETAWVVREPTHAYHEAPSRRLGSLVTRICQARGTEALCLGSTDLRIREADGRLTDIMQADERLTDIMQADELIFLNPERARLPGEALVPGEHDFPDVVLELDNTTDVRRGKLTAYREWGFPEIWVETPEAGSRSRRRSLRPEVRIYLREGDRYVEAEASRAFPGWRAEEIHRALNESTLSPETDEVLWRVGRELGRREGGEPEDDLLLGRIARRSQAKSQTEVLLAMAREVLAARGIPLSADFTARLSETIRGLAEPRQAVAAASAVAKSEADFFDRLS